MFANSYFSKSNSFRAYVTEPVDCSTGMIVVIPCLMEPDILETLRSLQECQPVEGITEVMLLVNESESCSTEVSDFNLQTLSSVKGWLEQNRMNKLRIFPIGPVRFPAKWAGVGLARKAGMDEALYRFNQLNNPDGIIVSLDADTVVESNYLVALEAYFNTHPEDAGATIRFSHRTEGMPDRQVKGIRLYEQYMYYYKHALDYAGYPHALYTIGSAFAVRAAAYMKRGGMTRRKAGEDFYFLQTLTQSGHVGEIESTCVYPSARVSQRVPFGTGPAMKKWMDGSDELEVTFNLQAFTDLKFLFSERELFYRSMGENLSGLVKSLPEPVCAFISEEGLTEDILQLSMNCGRAEIFNTRFFQLFNAFRILKFLNFSHPRFYDKVAVKRCLDELDKIEKGR